MPENKKKPEEVITSNEIQIIPTTRNYILVGDFRFEFGEKEVPFDDVVATLDNEINLFRNKCVERVAKELNAKVNFVE